MSTEMDEWIAGRREWSTAPVVTRSVSATRDQELAEAIRTAQNDLNSALTNACVAGLVVTASVSTTAKYAHVPYVAVEIMRKVL
jgi:hypothetical protein